MYFLFRKPYWSGFINPLITEYVLLASILAYTLPSQLRRLSGLQQDMSSLSLSGFSNKDIMPFLMSLVVHT